MTEDKKDSLMPTVTRTSPTSTYTSPPKKKKRKGQRNAKAFYSKGDGVPSVA